MSVNLSCVSPTLSCWPPVTSMSRVGCGWLPVLASIMSQSDRGGGWRRVVFEVDEPRRLRELGVPVVRQPLNPFGPPLRCPGVPMMRMVRRRLDRRQDHGAQTDAMQRDSQLD